MAVDKLVDSAQLDADLTSVANAIRTKGGTSASLAFPTGFVSAVEAIPSGGGGDSAYDILYGSAPTGEIILNADKDIPIGVLSGRKGITKLTIQFASGKKFARSSGNGQNLCLSSIPVLVLIGNSSSTLPGYFDQMNESHKVVVRGTFSGMENNAFRTTVGTSGLQIFDYTHTSGSIGANAFYQCNSFSTFIIRGSAVMPLSNTSAFTSANRWKSGGAGGTLYVPSALISSYQSATNWSTILGYTNNSIQAIEGSIYETQYADGTPIE